MREEIGSPIRIPARNADNIFFYFEFPVFPSPSPELQRFLRHFFRQCNTVIAVNAAALENKGNTFFFTLSRALVSELDILRYATTQLKNQNFTRQNSEAVGLDSYFYDLFGKVREHRNIIQHHGEYTFGRMKRADVKISEIKRLNLPIEIRAGGSIGAISGFFVNGSMLISSDQSGNLCEVFIGPELPFKIGALSSRACEIINGSGNLKLKLLTGLNESEVRQLTDKQA